MRTTQIVEINGQQYEETLIDGVVKCRTVLTVQSEKPKAIDFSDLISKLSLAKRKQLWALASTDEDVNDFLRLVSIQNVRLVDEPCVSDFLTALVATSFITQEQADNLLGI